MTAIRAGDKLDHYQIDALVARSGMASIFRATDLNTGKQVAVKVPHPEMEADVVLFDRFRREQDIGKKMDHPGVMKVYNDEPRSQVYMVMEWVDGKLLRTLMSEHGKLPQERSIRIIRQVCEALEYIHSRGVIHRDLKPENIMVNGDDHIKLIDFGLAGQEGSKRLTFAKLSQVMGTPTYISPEQVQGKRGDARSDIYAAGVMLYEMLTGKEPFSGPNPFAIMNDRLVNHPVPPREVDPSVTPQLQEIIYRALERDPKNRYPSAREFAHDLAHPEEVGVEDRLELVEWRKRKSPWKRNVMLYVALALIPVVVFSFLIWVARR